MFQHTGLHQVSRLSNSPSNSDSLLLCQSLGLQWTRFMTMSLVSGTQGLQFSQLCTLVIFRPVAKLGAVVLLRATPGSMPWSALEAEPFFQTPFHLFFQFRP